MILGEGETLLMEHLPLDVLGQAQSPDGLANGLAHSAGRDLDGKGGREPS